MASLTNVNGSSLVATDINLVNDLTGSEREREVGVQIANLQSQISDNLSSHVLGEKNIRAQINASEERLYQKLQTHLEKFLLNLLLLSNKQSMKGKEVVECDVGETTTELCMLHVVNEESDKTKPQGINEGETDKLYVETMEEMEIVGKRDVIDEHHQHVEHTEEYIEQHTE